MRIRRRITRGSVRSAALAWLLAAATTGGASAAPSFSIVVADDFVSGSLSADGSVVTFARASASGSAGLYDVATGTVTTLVSSADGVTTPVASQDGSVVVGGTFAPSGDEVYRFEGGVLTTLAPGSPLPAAISADGSVYAGNVLGAGGGAFLVNGGTITDLGTLPGGTDTLVQGLSGDGSVVVGSGGTTLGIEAFRWEGGAISGLGDLAGGSFHSEAFDISIDGSTIVGHGESASGTEAFLWSGGTMLGLGDLAGGAFASAARAVSGDGAVVVGQATDADGLAPFVWDGAHGMRNLVDVLTALGVDLDDWVLHGAIDVSADGRTLVGTGIDVSGGPDDGRSVLWVATIPEPRTALMLVEGLLVVALARRRGR